MNFVGLSIQFQVEATKEDPGAASNTAPEDRPNHPRLEQMRVALSSRPSDVVVGKRAGTVEGALGKDLGTIERHVHQEWKKCREPWKRLTIPDLQADDLEDIGILVGEVYDEKIIEECLHIGRNSINELLVNLNEQQKKGS